MTVGVLASDKSSEDCHVLRKNLLAIRGLGDRLSNMIQSVYFNLGKLSSYHAV